MLSLAVLPLAAALTATTPADARIRVNTVGFVPESPKLATVAAPCSTFDVVRVSDGEVVYSGKAGESVRTGGADTNETVQTIDFTTVKEPGTYRVVVPSIGASATFTVAQNVWNEPFQVVSRAMYLWRCGTAVEATWHGHTYRQEPCHLGDAWLDYAGGDHVKQASVGGWHDAGDYNKYPVNAGVTVGLMLKAWEQFGDRIRTVRAGIPESGNEVPDILDEVRWEAEWLLTMQQPDGKVYHKVSALTFKYWGPAEKDHDPRYFAPWSTVATADFAAIMAETARAWRPYDATFAQRCLAAAELSWKCLATHPQTVEPDLTAFKTGTYMTKDGSHRLWAAAELWETTGERTYLQRFEEQAQKFSVSRDGPTWGEVQDLAFATYLFSAHPAERSSSLVTRLSREFTTQARALVPVARSHGYGRPRGGDPRSWGWGCNGVVASQTFLLYVADQLAPDPAYRATAHDALSFLFGRNFNGRSYVTGLGANPPEHLHDRRGEPAWPGYLVGGSWPTGRDWQDEKANFRVNEIAINWNAALIYALAAFVEPGKSS